METIDKLHIADEMLDAAIAEFLDYERYFASFNLAGVAEEIYGNFAKFCGQSNILKETIDLARFIGNSDGGPELSNKEWRDIAIFDKNKIKHLDSLEDQYVTVDPRESARLMIADAISNHIKLKRDFSANMHRFYDFAYQWAKRNS